MTTSETPLSDLMSPFIAGGGPRELEAFHRAFLDAEVGLIVHGLPSKHEGWYRVDAHDGVTMPAFATPDGQAMVRVCADPKVFVERYDPRINARMRGRDALEMTLKMSDMQGAMVCSAASVHSIVIPRAEIPRLLELGASTPKRPWWKLFSRRLRG